MTRKGRRVAILGHTGRPGVRKAAARLASRLARRDHESKLERSLAVEMDREGHELAALSRWADLLVSLGGDGTALRGARAMAGKPGALLAVNLGGLGFLTAAEDSEIDFAVDAALAGEWPAPKRRLVDAEVRRAGARVHQAVAMNDAVVKTSGGYAAVHLRMKALGTDLGHLVADGLIAASAAGSTAYSLSAGGPVLAPDLEAMVVTPVCPHTLGSRSLVLPAEERVELRLVGAFDRTVLLLDGQESHDLETGDLISIGLGKAAVRLVRNPERPLGRALQTKLGWQGSEERSMK
jgi:NAD+ kinase